MSLVFFKEPHINTSTYQQAMENPLSVNFKTGDQASEELLAGIFGALNRYMLNLARRQIQFAFEQAEKEVADLHQRTREGIFVGHKICGKWLFLKEDILEYIDRH